jgi:hypothetical protein
MQKICKKKGTLKMIPAGVHCYSTRKKDLLQLVKEQELNKKSTTHQQNLELLPLLGTT